MEKHEDLTQTANKEETASVNYSEIKPPENEADKIDGDLMKQVNQEAACRLENTIFETTGRRMVAETKKDSGDSP
ncbi:MAG: hypothetical protein MUE70_12080 [Desulfobacterales bacterium]|jgi:hypothetical protein|nr:hypothetical protein [Desulfobacterales bacterium]